MVAIIDYGVGNLFSLKSSFAQIGAEVVVTDDVEVLKKAGISNYSIWNTGDTLVGYYECESIEYAAKVQAESPVVDRWNEYMKDVMVMEMDPVTGAQPRLEKVFELD